MKQPYIKPAVRLVTLAEQDPLLGINSLNNEQGGTQLSKPQGSFDEYEDFSDSENTVSPFGYKAP